MKVFISGGSGFFGHQIVAAAKAAGHEVYAPRSAEVDFFSGKGVNEYFDRLRSNGEVPDVFVHSAAYYGGIGITSNEPATIFHRNIQMGLRVFEAVREYEIPKILPIGSACSYPGYLQGDLQESAFWDGPLHATVEAYGFTKKNLLVAQNAYHKQHGIESLHLVLTNLYGPHDVFTEYRSHVVSALIKKFADAKAAGADVTLWGDGSPVREFLYVKDAAEAVVRALPLAHDTEPINIGTGIGTSIKELAEIIADLTNFDGTIHWDTSKPNGAARKVLDVRRMKEKLDWYPKYNARDGLAETISWYLENKEEADQRG